MKTKVPTRLPTQLPEPERWCELPALGASAEMAIGAALIQAREATEPTDAAVARVLRRIDEPQLSTRGRLLWRLAVAAVLIMATGGVVGAALKRWGRAEVGGDPRPRVEGDSARGGASNGRRARRGPRIAGPVGEVGDAPPPLAPNSLPIPAAAPSSAVAPLPSGPPAASAPLSPPSLPAPPANVPRAMKRPASSGPASEAAVLTDAFRELRANGDPAAALRSLDAYDRRFAGGTLRDEARIARAEALLALNRRRDALALLDQIRGPRSALTREVRITRGELLAEVGRCSDARRDFDVVLTARDNDTPGGRALYGRAACHLRAGDVSAARQDLERYLRLHPDGPSAVAARRAAESLQ